MPTLKDRLEFTKVAVELVRDLCIAALVIILLLSPGTVNRTLAALGITDFDVWGFKGKTSLADVSQELAFMKQVNATLTSELQGKHGSQEVISAAQAAQTRAGQVLDENASQIAAAEQVIASPGLWAVVFGADISESDAQKEIDRAKSASFQAAQVYLRQGWYRSVVPFSNRDAAMKALPKIRALSSHSGGAYAVNLGTWCRNAISAGGITECK